VADLFRTTDAGAHWSVDALPLPPSSYTLVFVRRPWCGAAGQCLVAVDVGDNPTCGGSPGCEKTLLFGSVDGGSSWSLIPGPGVSDFDVVCSAVPFCSANTAPVDPIRPSRVAFSSDLGRQWGAPRSLLTPVTGPAVCGGDERCLAPGSSSSSLFQSSTGGASWDTPHASANGVSSLYGCGGGGRCFVVQSSDQFGGVVVAVTSLAGQSWTVRQLPRPVLVRLDS
jgi:hypothetical protein